MRIELSCDAVALKCGNPWLARMLFYGIVVARIC